MSDREKPPLSTMRADVSPMEPEVFASLNRLPPQDENGVDLSMIDWMLSLTPAQRIERNYQARLFIEKLRSVAG